MRHIIPISGKDSLATALVQTASEPYLPYEYYFVNAGAELPETLRWIDHVAEACGWDIQHVQGDIVGRMRQFDLLPSHKRRWCTKYEKIKRAEAMIGRTDEVTAYYGLRADEAGRASTLSPLPNVVARFPLVETGLDFRAVWRLLALKDLLPPAFFWPSLYWRVCELVGGDRLESVLEPWEFYSLFSGRSRSNCFFCFYQRQYEYLWLHEAHPDLFWEACWLERSTGKRTTFTWREGYYLDELLARRGEILNRRAKQVAAVIISRMQHTLIRMVDDTEISTVSCGLLCGK